MKRNNGFTLIELLIVITIIGIISLVSYAPYNYYKNKAELKNTASKISQLLYESRNKAINGSVGTNGNVSIGVYFDSSNKNEINILSYPYNYDTGSISYITNSNIKNIKKVILGKGMQIDEIDGLNNLLFYFNAITGKVSYYTWNGATRNNITGNKIDINFSYKGATSRNLNKSISYFTYTNIIDY